MLRIDRLILRNYRCFKEFEIDFHPRVTVLTARNGQGKTAVLDALGLSLTPLLSSFPEVFGQHIRPQDVYLDNQGENVESLYPCRIEVHGQLGSQSESWVRELRSYKGRTTNKDAQVLTRLARRIGMDVQEQAKEPIPLIAHYGTDRLWNSIKLTSNKKAANLTGSRLAGYLDCLNPASNFKWVQDWLGRTLMDYHESKEAGNLESYRYLARQSRWMGDTLKAFLQPVIIVDALVYSWRNQELRLISQKRPLAVDQLSDGTRIVLGLVADLTHRAIRLNPHLKNPMQETPGIVLIDEVDLHLHPQWQQQLLSQLQSTFPKLQFIVTSHSEQVVSTVHRDQVRILEPDTGIAPQPDGETYAGRSNQVLERVFAVESRPPLPIVGQLRDYLERVQTGNGLDAEATQLREALDAQLGREDPDLLRADAMLARQRVIGGGRA